MHELQQRILKIAKESDLSKCGLRKLGKIINEKHPQKIKYHLEQLENKKFVKLNKERTRIIKVLSKDIDVSSKKQKLFRLPILGCANCGPATMFSEQNLEGYLPVSKSILGNKNINNLFVVRAVGDSLNRAENVEGGTIEDGDYVIIDKSIKDPTNGLYVLSIIDDLANLKRFYKNKNEIRLVSESSLNIQPIILDVRDLADFDYLINGVILRVIKK